ncbi:hypothetical protein HPP92_004178 [Vanilla planifolia]|uniref:TORTIFOLIA1/SINE1-2 N-terminal domain-containing protein n=1 Tax=Vanilla planifolia TaxID=51239 RepID=A0A835S9Q2_VANPL|nr:hypothetical protein HPP92_004178 [Vanilla planifolia]
MGRSLSPLVQQELENLEKDAESRRSAMKALKFYATNMDTKAIPQFLAQVSETNQGLPSGECTISLFEVLARVHGRSIVPQIESIITTIIRTLSTSAGSFPLHQACSKVVPAIARYGIDPSTPDGEKKEIIALLCNPLCDVLMSSNENLASGAALCLKALVESNNWKFASDNTINDVCLKVASALEEKTTQTNSHMGLAMALAKHNSSIAEGYVGSLIRSGLHILRIGSADNNSQKRFSAIQMVNFLMKCLDCRGISSEFAAVIDAMEKCQADQMPYVRGAAYEALQTARGIAPQKGSKLAMYSNPTILPNAQRIIEKSPHSVQDNMPKLTVEFPSPESHTVTSSIKHEALTDSPSSVKHGNYLSRRAQRRLWNNDLCGMDLSFKDSFLIKACSNSDLAQAEEEQMNNVNDHEISMTYVEEAASFTGFLQSSAGRTASRSTSPSPQRLRKQLTIDDIKIYTTPRKLIRSLQNQNGGKREDSEMLERNPIPCNVQCETTNEQKMVQSIESVSSTADPTEEIDQTRTSESASAGLKGKQIDILKMAWCRKSFIVFVCGLAVLCVGILMLNLMKDGEEYSFGLVPT